MIRHNKTAHTANDYSCADCDVSFSRREDLGRHVRKVHNEIITDSLKRHMKSVH